MKKIGTPRPPKKAGSIKFQQGRLDGVVDFIVLFGDDTPRCDRYLIMSLFCYERQRFDTSLGRPIYENSLVKELESRGYDMSTLRFSIDKK